MAGANINFGLSVFKREARDAAEVIRKLQQDGWNKTGELAGGRVTYWEKSGINITVVDGPVGTTIMPSGPIRGALFGKNVPIFSRTSSIGLGKTQQAEKQTQSQMRGSRRTGESTFL